MLKNALLRLAPFTVSCKKYFLKLHFIFFVVFFFSSIDLDVMGPLASRLIDLPLAVETGDSVW